MADLEMRFPETVSINAVGGPRFKNSIAVMASGAEARVQEWELERGEWVVAFSARRPEDWRELLAFFRIVAGQANTFRFKDWTDYVCLQGDGFFVDDGSGSPTRFQMVKRYTYRGYTHDRYITKPISGKITTDATGLDYATGTATGGTFWYGEFDCWCRLNIDKQDLRVLDKNINLGILAGWESIEVVEVTGEVR